MIDHDCRFYAEETARTIVGVYPLSDSEISALADLIEILVNQSNGSELLEAARIDASNCPSAVLKFAKARLTSDQHFRES